MDILFWGLLMLFAVFFTLVIHRGFQRWRDHVAVASGERTQRNASMGIGTTDVDFDQKGNFPYINALRSHNPEEIAKAPLPEHFSEELLLQALLRIQNQPSLYDLFLERLTEQFTISQYERLISAWKRYCNSLGEGMASQNAFLRQLSERLTMHLETQKRAASLEADIAQEIFRAADANNKRERLVTPEPESMQERQDTIESLQEELNNALRVRREAMEGARDDGEREAIEAHFDEVTRQIRSRIRRLRDAT